MAIKLGFLGFGIMGERLLRAALQHDRDVVNVSGVFDPRSDTAERLNKIDPTLQVFETAEAVIAASDCLHIASPPSSHLAYLEQCAANAKAALCEKPLATNIVAARAAIDRVQARGMRAGVNFPFASSFAVDQISRWLEAGVIGVPQRIDIDLQFAAWPRSWQMDAVRWLDGRAEGGFTREVGSHFLFLTQRLFGPLAIEMAECRYPVAGASERQIEVQLKAGVLPVRLSGSVGTTAKDDHNTWTVTGPNGRVRLRDWSFAERFADGDWQSEPGALPNEKLRPLVLARQLDKIAAMTAGRETNLATLEEGFAVQSLVEAILQSERTA